MARSKSRGNGEGSIFKRADGRWVAYITVKMTADGKQKRKAYYGKTRKEAADKMAAGLKELRQGIFIEPLKTTVSEYLKEWYEQIARKRLRETTLATYESHLRIHIMPDLGHVLLQQLTNAQVQNYLDDLHDLGLAKSTIVYSHAIIHRALNYAYKKQMIAFNPADGVEFPKEEGTEMNALNVEQATRFLAALEGERMAAYYIVSIVLGMRRGEALGLAWTDLDIEQATIRVRRSLLVLNDGVKLQGLKNESSHRVVHVPVAVLTALRAHLLRQLDERNKAGSKWHVSGLIFTTSIGTPYNPGNIRRDFLRILKKAELPPMRVHDLRHSAASLMRSQGIDISVISKILGHANIRTTSNIYMHIFDEDKRDAASKMDNFLQQAEQDKTDKTDKT